MDLEGDPGSQAAAAGLARSLEVACRTGLTKPSVEAQEAGGSRSGEDTDHSVVDVDYSVEGIGRCSVEAGGPEIVGVDCASAGWACSSHAVVANLVMEVPHVSQDDRNRRHGAVCMDGECGQRVRVVAGDIFERRYRCCDGIEGAKGLERKRKRSKNLNGGHAGMVVDFEAFPCPNPPSHLQRVLGSARS